MLQIQFLTSDTVHPDRYWNPGMGGSPTSLHQLTRHLSRDGYKIRVVANLGGHPEGEYEGVYYTEWVAPTCDVLVYFRGSFPLAVPVTCQKKIWWSTDAYLEGDNWQLLWRKVDQGVCISNFHLQDLTNRYGIPTLPPMTVIPLGCDPQEKKQVEKIPNRLIYCSEPARGLVEILRRWSAIRDAVPNATLDITFDYRLWNSTPNIGHYSILAHQPGINYRGLVNRSELLQLQAQAELHVYPCTFPENFCLSSLECQLQSTPTITTSIGALPTTVDGGGICTNSYDEIVNKTIHLLTNRGDLKDLQSKAFQHAQTLTWGKAAKEWENLLCGFRT